MFVNKCGLRITWLWLFCALIGVQCPLLGIQSLLFGVQPRNKLDFRHDAKSASLKARENDKTIQNGVE